MFRMASLFGMALQLEAVFSRNDCSCEACLSAEKELFHKERSKACIENSLDLAGSVLRRESFLEQLLICFRRDLQLDVS